MKAKPKKKASVKAWAIKTTLEKNDLNLMLIFHSKSAARYHMGKLFPSNHIVRVRIEEV